MGKLKHLGIESAPCRSTLSYANEKRSWKLYEAVFYHLLGICRMVAPTKKKFRFKNAAPSLDATLIELCVSLFDWATYRQTKEHPNSIFCSTMMAIFLSLPISPMGTYMTLPLPRPYLPQRLNCRHRRGISLLLFAGGHREASGL